MGTLVVFLVLFCVGVSGECQENNCMEYPYLVVLRHLINKVQEIARDSAFTSCVEEWIHFASGIVDLIPQCFQALVEADPIKIAPLHIFFTVIMTLFFFSLYVAYLKRTIRSLRGEKKSLSNQLDNDNQMFTGKVTCLKNQLQQESNSSKQQIQALTRKFQDALNLVVISQTQGKARLAEAEDKLKNSELSHLYQVETLKGEMSTDKRYIARLERDIDFYRHRFTQKNDPSMVCDIRHLMVRRLQLELKKLHLTLAARNYLVDDMMSVPYIRDCVYDLGILLPCSAMKLPHEKLLPPNHISPMARSARRQTLYVIMEEESDGNTCSNVGASQTCPSPPEYSQLDAVCTSY